MADQLATHPQIGLLPRKMKDMGDGSFAEVIYAENAGGAGGDGVDRETVVTTYRVKTAFTGASVGDTVNAIRVLDVSGSSASQVGATIWYNESTAATLASAPSIANLESAGTVGLTDAQLRAAAVPVVDSAQNTKLDTIIASLSTIDGRVDGLEGLATTLNGYVDGLETLATTLNGYTDTLEALITAMSAKLPASLGNKAPSASLSVAPPLLVAGTTRNGSITVGGTAQVLAAANASRISLEGQNLHEEEDLWINEQGATAVIGAAGSYCVPPKGTFQISTSNQISVIAATTGHAWTATEN